MKKSAWPFGFALFNLAPGAWAHEGHGLGTTHWHATDALGFVVAAALVAMAGHGLNTQLVAAALVPRSVVTALGVVVNPLRTGVYETLETMGADISLSKTDRNELIEFLLDSPGPNANPPQPFLSIGVNLNLAWGQMRAGKEG